MSLAGRETTQITESRGSARADGSRWRASLAGTVLPIAGVLAVYYAAATAVVEHWRSRGWYAPSGDEPHYLTVAYSLAHYHTADVRRAYLHDVATQMFKGLFPPGAKLTPLSTHSVLGPHGLYSVHGVGLPALLVPGMLAAGVNGARLTMVAVSGIAVGVVAYTCLRRFRSTPVAVVAALVLVLGMPLLPAAGQIYPDLPAGAVAASVVAALFLSGGTLRGRPTARPLAVDALLTALVAYEPWIHDKEIAPAVIATAALAWTAARAGHRTRAMVMVAVVLVSLILLAGYNEYAYGTILTYSAGNSTSGPDQTLMVFLGLHLDSVQGIFVQAPILVLGLAGLIRGCWRRQVWAVTAILTYLVVMVPNATYVNMYGGGSFAGRFGWTAALILMVPAVDLMADLWENHRILLATLMVAEIFFEAVAFVRYTIDHFVLYSQILVGVPVAWARDYPTIWGRLGRLLPSYDATGWVWRYAPDILAPVVLVAALAASIVLARSPQPPRMGAPRHRIGPRPELRGGNLRAAAPFLAGLVVSAGVYGWASTGSSVPRPPLTMPAALLPRLQGQVDPAGAVVVRDPPAPAGYVTFGPPFFLAPGTYEATFDMAVDGPPGSPVAGWDVVASSGSLASLGPDSLVVARGSVIADHGLWETVTSRFTLPHGPLAWGVQTRTVLHGPGTLSVHSVGVQAYRR